MEQHNNNPPSKYTYTEPDIIIGVELKPDFIKHYKNTQFKQTREGFDQAVSNIPDNIRAKISDAYIRLREAGWFVCGIDKYENLFWRRSIINPEIDDTPMPDIKEQRKRIRESKADMLDSIPNADIFKDYKDGQY